MPKANRSAADPGDFWIEEPFLTKKFPRGGYYHSWRILDERIFFRITEKHADTQVIAKEIKEAVQAVFKKHYGEQHGVSEIEG